MVSLWRRAMPETRLSLGDVWSMYDEATFHWREGILLTFSCHMLNVEDAMSSRLEIEGALLPPQWTDPIGDIPASANLLIVFTIARLWARRQSSFKSRTRLSRSPAMLSADSENSCEWLTSATDTSSFTSGYSTDNARAPLLKCHSGLVGLIQCNLCQFRRDLK